MNPAPEGTWRCLAHVHLFLAVGRGQNAKKPLISPRSIGESPVGVKENLIAPLEPCPPEESCKGGPLWGAVWPSVS